MVNRKLVIVALAFAGGVGAAALARRSAAQRGLSQKIRETLATAERAARNRKLGRHRDRPEEELWRSAGNLWGRYGLDESLEEEEEEDLDEDFEDEEKEDENEDRQASEEAFERYLAALEAAQKKKRAAAPKRVRPPAKPTEVPPAPEPALPTQAGPKPRIHRPLPSSGIVIGGPAPGTALNPHVRNGSPPDLPSAGIVIGGPAPGPARKPRARKSAPPVSPEA